MHDRDGFIWYDGECVPWQSATTHVLTHSLHYGLSVLEGLRAYRTRAGTTAIFRAAEHVRRFLGSAHAFRMKVPFDAASIERALFEVMRKNRLEQAYLRPLAFYGSEKMGVSPIGASVHLMVAAWPWQDYFPPDARERGLRVKTSSFARQPPGVALPRAKIAASYTNAILAKLEASEDGYDEALMLDTAGFVAEGPGENLFIVRDGELFEPELTSALVGITRDTIVALARDQGLRVSERRLTRDDVYLADEAFFTGTAVEVVPVVELDHRAIGTGKPGPITQRLQESYARAVRGGDPRHEDWLTLVPGH
jgi:branched-chain amino acid aminotransferase